MNSGTGLHLARLRVQYPLWTIRRVRSGTGFTAHRTASRQRMWHPGLDQLERALWATDRGNRGPKARKPREQPHRL